MNSIFVSLSEQKLQWLPELGIGYYPVTDQPYDAEYWQNYRRLDSTATGLQLTEGRVDLVDAHWPGEVVDIGIGGGLFVASRRRTQGFDVNPHALNWLADQGAFFDPYSEPCDAACFWDSLEHIHNPAPILHNVRHYVFISTPIYRDCEHVMRSKHFKPSEHCWYFTNEGLINFMRMFRFELVTFDTRERDCGREDITSFVFRRV